MLQDCFVLIFVIGRHSDDLFVIKGFEGAEGILGVMVGFLSLLVFAWECEFEGDIYRAPRSEMSEK